MTVLFYNSNRSVAFGGIEHWMLDVASGLGGRGRSAVLYGRRGAGWLREAKARGITTIEGVFGTDLDLRSIVHLRATLRTHQVQVVFAKGKKATRTAAIATRLAGRGRVVLLLGIDGELSDRALDRWTWRCAVDRAVVLAEEAKRWYERFAWAADGKLRVLLKGVDVSVLDPQRVPATPARVALGIPAPAVVLGSVGRLVWQKGHVHLLRAAARLRADLPDLWVVIVGDGEEKGPLLEEAQRLGLEDRVTLAGYRRDIPSFVAAMDIFALPSRRENMPQALLEAMAMARPIVSTDTIGVREILDDGVSGFVVPTGDVCALADRVLRLARDVKLRAAMGNRARARILNGLTREDMLSRVECLLAELS